MVLIIDISVEERKKEIGELRGIRDLWFLLIVLSLWDSCKYDALAISILSLFYNLRSLFHRGQTRRADLCDIS